MSWNVSFTKCDSWHDSKKIWKAVKTFLSYEVTNFPKISLIEKSKLISYESEAANSSSNLLKNATQWICH